MDLLFLVIIFTEFISYLFRLFWEFMSLVARQAEGCAHFLGMRSEDTIFHMPKEWDD